MRKTVDYRGHKVIVSDHLGSPKGQVFIGQTQVSQDRFEGELFENVFEQAKKWIDERLANYSSAKRAPNVAVPERYAEYIGKFGLKSHEKAMLVSHAKNGILTATQLAAAAGWSSYEPANLHYGCLGQEVSEFLELTVPKRKNNKSVWTMALADGLGEESDSESGHFQWKIHPELVKGLVIAGVLDAEPEWLTNDEY